MKRPTDFPLTRDERDATIRALVELTTTRAGAMRHTKTDMARVIVQALYRLPCLPAANDKRVKRYASNRLPIVERQHKLAVNVILQGAADGTWPVGKCA